MVETKSGGMQSLPRKIRDNLGQRGRAALGGPVGPSINSIADQRVADMGHMDAHLVRTAGFEPAFNQAGERPA